MKGRRPKPAIVKQFRGNPGKRPIPKTEPQPPAARVVRPAELSRVAVVVWNVLAPLAIEMGTLTASDVYAFRTLCELQGTLDLVSAQKDADAFRLFTTRGMVDVIRLERQYATALRPYYAMFGLDPADRSRIALPTKAKPPVSKWTGMFPGDSGA